MVTNKLIFPRKYRLLSSFQANIERKLIIERKLTVIHSVAKLIERDLSRHTKFYVQLRC